MRPIGEVARHEPQLTAMSTGQSTYGVVMVRMRASSELPEQVNPKWRFCGVVSFPAG
ncbi:hypothetical protein [Streptomyces niveus]|uniref:hypothetical protein n=1 Tax=Streptomyces niveus TaxID=193462 RepID=UPI0035DA6852